MLLCLLFCLRSSVYQELCEILCMTLFSCINRNTTIRTVPLPSLLNSRVGICYIIISYTLLKLLLKVILKHESECCILLCSPTHAPWLETTSDIKLNITCRNICLSLDTCAVSLSVSREQPYIKAVDKDNNNNLLYVCFSPMSLGCDLRGGTVKSKVGQDELTMYCARLGMKNSPCTVVNWAWRTY